MIHILWTFCAIAVLDVNGNYDCDNDLRKTERIKVELWLIFFQLYCICGAKYHFDSVIQ